MRKTPTKSLLLDVKKLNKEAWEWLVNEYKPTTPDEEGDLINLFDWEDSPQGHNFWCNICKNI